MTVRIRREIAELAPYVQGRPAPVGAYKLSSNENPFVPLPQVVIAAATRDINRYPDASAMDVRSRIADRFSRVSSGQADVGANLPLIVIAVVVVGGTSIFGGEGAIWRTGFGVLLYAMIGNGFTLLNVNSTIQQVVQGAILLCAVGLDAYSRRGR